ncbi:MAG: TraB/GumN family protein [Acidobacteriota bacterium]
MESSIETTPSQTAGLPASARLVQLGEREIILLGTAHVSRRSVEEVRDVIAREKPDVVAVELDEQRLRNLLDPEQWKRTDVVAVIRQGKALLLLSSLLMASIQRRIGKQLGVEPGAELREAVEQGRRSGAHIELIDRDIRITLRRAWKRIRLRERFKVLFQMVGGLFAADELDAETIESLKQDEKLGDVLEMLADEFPAVKGVLIDERDRYMAEKLRRISARKIVAVVGAGHVPGILRELERPQDLSVLEAVPPRSPWARILQWGIPLVVLAMLAAGFINGSTAQSWENVKIWFLVNGVLSAAGAALAFGHPVTILSAFLAAPLTSLNPLIAAGWVAGLVQALVRRPRVEDFQGLPEAITSLRGFWRNAVTRILLVVAFANLGSMLGTFIAGGWIAARLVQ